jgi:hypothetical protein
MLCNISVGMATYQGQERLQFFSNVSARGPVLLILPALLSLLAAEVMHNGRNFLIACARRKGTRLRCFTYYIFTLHRSLFLQHLTSVSLHKLALNPKRNVILRLLYSGMWCCSLIHGTRLCFEDRNFCCPEYVGNGFF